MQCDWRTNLLVKTRVPWILKFDKDFEPVKVVENNSLHAPNDEVFSKGTGNMWTASLIELLCSLHIIKLENYHKYAKAEKEKVNITTMALIQL